VIGHVTQDVESYDRSATARREGEKVNATVLLCTYNRCALIPKVLDSLAAQSLPDSFTWEVIVIDNNSRDQTRVVVEEYERKFPDRFRYVFEAEQGLSRARNTGIRNARGEVIAFVDDDVIAEPDWLKNLTASLFRGTWAGAGGRIAAPIGFIPPKWLPIGGRFDLGGALALFDLGNEARAMTRAPYGTNMAFRKSVFQRYGGFRTDLGRCGNSLLSGEDTEFGNRLFAANEQLRYEPSAVIHHPAPPERLHKSYFRNWWFNFGRTRIIERDRRPAAFGIPREYISIFNLAWRYLPSRIVRWLMTLEPKERFYHECQVCLTFGEVVENYRVARSPRRTPPQTYARSIEQE
jgi:glycosyltransferase involved in cell wall biosynthesis